jgi:hypothetical protein
VWALLTMIQAWIAAGRPEGSGPVLGSVESWCRVMGGIFHACGLEGFLSNLDEFRAEADDETGSWTAFVEAWWAAHGGNEVHAADLYEAARDHISMRGESRRDQEVSLGMQLGQKRDRRFGDRFIRKVGAGGHRAWQLVEAGGPKKVSKVSEVSHQASDQHERKDTFGTPSPDGEVPEVSRKPAGRTPRDTSDTYSRVGSADERDAAAEAELFEALDAFGEQ